MCDLWNRWNGQVVDNRNYGKPSQGATPGQGVGGGSIAGLGYPVSKTEKDPFTWCCED
jgi:hypothetical protein